MPERRNLVVCVIADEADNVLLLHRKAPAQWEIPGGKPDPNENLKKAIGREIREELGVGVRILGSLAVVPIKHNEDYYETHLFEARIDSGTPRIQEAAHDDLRYMNLHAFGVGRFGLSAGAAYLAHALQNDELKLGAAQDN